MQWSHEVDGSKVNALGCPPTLARGPLVIDGAKWKDHAMTLSARGNFKPEDGLRIETHLLSGNRFFPNNPVLPVLIYREGFPTMDETSLEDTFRPLFESNGWSGCWCGDVYDFHHYHSNTHEVMGVCSGKANLELGGPDCLQVEVFPGDVLVLPAGIGHRRAASTEDFEVLGAYPGGKTWNLCYGTEEELPHARALISRVPIPPDPVLGEAGGIAVYWNAPPR